ncbi:MAG: DUF1292 domain-containing protein [Gudongella sp.]|nr:DUF1292 domain-containing protein [Gudongella sp.]
MMSDNKHVHDEHCNHDHDHDHDHEHEEMEIITLTLDDDSELECAVIGIFEVEDKEFIALLPLGNEEEEEEDEVLLYEYKELGEEEFELALIEDEEEFDLVSEAFYALYTDEDEDEEDEE